MRIHLLVIVLVVVALMMVGLWGCGKKKEAAPTVGQEGQQYGPGNPPPGFEDIQKTQRDMGRLQQPAQRGQQQAPAPTGR